MARVAEANARRCQYEHDACRNTPTFKTSGQNLGINGAPEYPDPTASVQTILGLWWNEYENGTEENINPYSPSSP